MLQKIANFIKYNNAFTIGVMAVFMGAGMSFAASPALRDSVYSSSQTVMSVDNRAIVSAVLDSFSFNLKITAVTEDTDKYYVNYSYDTLAVVDSIWQRVTQSKTMTVVKASLDGKDLGLYVAKELGDNINYELAYLKRVQDIEKSKGTSQKIVTVQYAGLVGKLFDPKQEVIEGYNPVIPETAAVAQAVTRAPVADVVNTDVPQSSTPSQTLSEDQIKKIVQDMLAQSQAPAQVAVPVSPDVPLATPETPVPTVDPVPDATPSVLTLPSSTTTDIQTAPTVTSDFSETLHLSPVPVTDSSSSSDTGI